MLGRLNRNNPVPITRADVVGLLSGAAFAAVLLLPLRHYKGDRKQTERAKSERDSFPLSTYPMFTADRRGRQIIPHVIGLTANGDRVPLHYRHYGHGGLNQVRKQIARAVRQGNAVDTAQRYADSLARNPRQLERDVEEVAVVRSRFFFDDYFGARGGRTAQSADNSPAAENVHARCPVGGRAVGHDPGRLRRGERKRR